MRRPYRMNEAKRQEIVRLFTQDKLSMRQIAPRFGVSHVCIAKVLTKAGVDTSKAVACWVEETCSWCESAYRVTRAKWRAKGPKSKTFCSEACRKSWMTELGKNYYPWRHGQNLARRVVAGICGRRGKLPKGSVVHHIDGNCWHNDPSNLMLFASNGDHTRWHRGDRALVTPLWDGSIPARG
jgi:hypothetical protein